MIDERAAVHPEARLGADVVVGPFAVVEADVDLGDRVVVGPHSVVHSGTRIGADTRLMTHVVLGGAPQDVGHDPAVPTRLIIGRGNVFHEFTTAHRGSSRGRGVTRIGDHNRFMANSHVAHDCVVGSGCTFANSAAIGGFVEVGDRAFLGGLCAVHQHARVGRAAMVGGGALCSRDVPPFHTVSGERARVTGVNTVGLQRGPFAPGVEVALAEASTVLFRGGRPDEAALAEAEARWANVPEVRELCRFVRASTRGVCRAAQA